MLCTIFALKAFVSQLELPCGLNQIKPYVRKLQPTLVLVQIRLNLWTCDTDEKVRAQH